MKRASIVVVLGLSLLLGFALTVYAQGGETSGTAGPAAGDIAILFAPMVAAATGIERLLEMLWNWFESFLLNIVAIIAMGWEWTRWAREEITKASAAVGELAAQLSELRGKTPAARGSPEESALLKAMRDAESQLLLAETRLQNVLKNERYRRIKGALSVLAGIVLGVIIAAAANLKMFAVLGIALVPAEIDILVTGLVIGTGSAPVHSLIGILQKSKDTLEDTSRLLRGRYELTVNTARSPDLAAMRTSDGRLSAEYDVYLSKRAV